MTAFKNSFVVIDYVEMKYSFKRIDIVLFKIDKEAMGRQKKIFSIPYFESQIKFKCFCSRRENESCLLTKFILFLKGSLTEQQYLLRM